MTQQLNTNGKLRVAIGALSLESNRNAPVLTFEGCRQYYSGQDLQAGFEHNLLPIECKGFKAHLDTVCDWEFVPLPLLNGGAAGELDQSCMDNFMSHFLDELKAAIPVDVVYLPLHGGAAATVDPDPEGTLLEAVRNIVGQDIPILATLDLHAHVTETMLQGADFLCSYLTNPHIDMFERGEETAKVLVEMLQGQTITSGFCKVPMMGPSTSLSTEAGPYADIIEYGQNKLTDPDIINISVCSGFSVGDNVYAGMSVVVSTRNNQVLAEQTALDIAAFAWNKRHEFSVQLTSIEDSVQEAYDACEGIRQPVILADVADNPGGGGTGNTMYLLQALVEKGCYGGFVGVIWDPDLVNEAFEQGEGVSFTAVFNRTPLPPFVEPYSTQARIELLKEGSTDCRRGLWAGSSMNFGKRVLLDINGIKVLVSSNRRQLADPAILEELGIDIAELSFLVVKSRGHFRAGFDEFFAPNQIIESDAPGLTTPVLANIPYKRVRRPVYPLDSEMTWQPVLGDYQP